MPLDLHVLGLSLAFILSQDQTLRCNIYSFYIFLLHVKVVHPCPGVRLSCFYLDVDLFPLRFPEKGPSLSTIISVYRNTFNELLSFLAPLEARKFCKDKNFFTPKFFSNFFWNSIVVSFFAAVSLYLPSLEKRCKDNPFYSSIPNFQRVTLSTYLSTNMDKYLHNKYLSCW